MRALLTVDKHLLWCPSAWKAATA